MTLLADFYITIGVIVVLLIIALAKEMSSVMKLVMVLMVATVAVWIENPQWIKEAWMYVQFTLSGI